MKSSNAALQAAEELIYSATLNRVSALLAAAAVRRDGAEISWLSTRVAIVNARGKRFLIDGAINHESVVGSLIVDDKELARRFFHEQGVQAPQGRLVQDADDAVAYARSLDRAVVVKPRIGSAGKGVSVELRDPGEIRAAYERAAARGRGVIVEECLNFKDEYRCIVTPDMCLAVVKRVLPRVTGDGRRTVEELIDDKNIERRGNPMLERIPIPKDSVVKTVLAPQGLTLESVPAQGREVLVRNVGGLSGGGEPHEVSDQVDPRIKQVAIAAVSAIPGLPWAGVDVVLDTKTDRPYVLEANINAGYGGATFPIKGEAKDVAGAVWEIRRNMGSDDLVVESAAPSLARRSHTVAEDLGSLLPGANRSFMIGDLMESFLADGGWSVTPVGKVFGAVDASGATWWFLRSGGSERDLLGPRRLLRRHYMVRRFLHHERVLRPKGTLIKDVVSFRRVFGETTLPIDMLPRGDSWQGAEHRTARPDRAQEILAESHGSWYCQVRLPGTRVRIYANRETGLWVTTSDSGKELTAEALQAASALAVRAVRSIPELRWAAVEVLVRRPREDDLAPRVMVEGLLPNPKIRPHDRVLGGKARELVEWLCRTGSASA